MAQPIQHLPEFDTLLGKTYRIFSNGPDRNLAVMSITWERDVILPSWPAETRRCQPVVGFSAPRKM